MIEIFPQKAEYIDRLPLLQRLDNAMKTCNSAEAKKILDKMAVWVMGAVTPDLRSDIQASKVVTQYGLYCSHCYTTCAVGDRFCRLCGGRFV